MSSSSTSSSSSSPYTQVHIKAWSDYTLPIVIQRGERVEWEYKTQAHDIGFEARFRPHADTPLDDDDEEEMDEEMKKKLAEEGEDIETKTKSNSSSSSSSSPSPPPPPALELIHPLQRVSNPHQFVQAGSFQCPPQHRSGTLELHWDNTYSKMRGKQLLYSWRIIRDTDSSLILLGERYHTVFGDGVIEGERVDAHTTIYLVRLQWAYAYLNREAILTPCTPERSINERCVVGVSLFFNNDILRAESFFRADTERHPVFSLAYSSMGFLRALMTWEKADIALANARLKQTRHLVGGLLPPDASLLGSLSRMVMGGATQPLSPRELELSLIKAESYLLEANLLLTEESMFSYIKAGLKIRSAWKLYEKIYKQVNSSPELEQELDESVRGGIQFGIGTFNIVISILPAILLRVVSALGFPSDRALGLRLLTQCSKGGGVRAPLSSLTLLFIHIIIPSFFTVRTKYHVSHAHHILQSAFELYPHGALFLWMEGRLNRMLRQLPLAIQSFERSARGQPDWLQLQHLCAYELGWCYFFQLNWSKSSTYFQRLEMENSWSKAFFIYMQAVCTLVTHGDDEPLPIESAESFQARIIEAQNNAATPLFQKIEPAVNRKFGGKTISIEQFILHRTSQFLKHKIRPILPALELIYLFYGFIQMDAALLDKCHAQVSAVLSKSDSLSPDHLHLSTLILSSIEKAQHRYESALKRLVEMEENVADSAIQDDKYILPFCRFEIGTCILEQVVQQDEQRHGNNHVHVDKHHHKHQKNHKHTPASSSSSSSASDNDYQHHRVALLDQALSYLKKSENTKYDYHFKNRLHLRCHLAQEDLKVLRQHINWTELDEEKSQE